jgi:hypothetical protein
MKIDLQTIDTDSFMIHPHLVGGETVYLVQPIGFNPKWNQANKHFRSSVWNSDGELISAGFPKFTNWGENPDNFPTPTSLKDAVVTEKLDGSLLIVSKYKGQFIIRTRGTIDASKMENGHELEFFKQKYPKVFSFMNDGNTWDCSLLFEWTSPLNRIVCRYGDEPTFSLIGIIYHSDYSLAGQGTINVIARELEVPRPKTYKFNDVSELLEQVDQWVNQEGVVVYSKDGQASAQSEVWVIIWC